MCIFAVFHQTISFSCPCSHSKIHICWPDYGRLRYWHGLGTTFKATYKCRLHRTKTKKTYLLYLQTQLLDCLKNGNSNSPCDTTTSLTPSSHAAVTGTEENLKSTFNTLRGEGCYTVLLLNTRTTLQAYCISKTLQRRHRFYLPNHTL